MKLTILIILLCGMTTICRSQYVGVERSTMGIQTGFLGIWWHNEAKLSNRIAVRTELGFDSGIWGGSFYNNTGFLLTPVITFEPRWYYNLGKRFKKDKRTDGNSGNFFSLKTSFHPDWFVISNQSGISVISDVSIVPTWGMRRHIGDHFTYEAGFGLGYQYLFAKDAGYAENEDDILVNLHLRFGYRF